MPAHPNSIVQDVAEIVADHMDAILRRFKPGRKITVLVRNPDDPTGKEDFVLTNDLIDEATAALLRRKHGNGITGTV